MNFQELEKRNKILEKRWKIAIIVAIVFVTSRPIALFITNKVIHKAVFNATNNRYPLIDPARQFIPQDDFLNNIQPLRDYLNELETRVGKDNISIYYEQLNSGANISINKNLRLYPASLAKLALAIIVVEKIEKGIWKWDTKFQPTPSDLSSDSGELYKTIGTNPVTIEQLIEELLINSDNTAQNILRRNVQISDFLDLQKETGLDDLFDEKGFVSAKEYSRILRVLYTSSFLERENSQKILQLMSEARFHDYLSQGIPDHIPFAHKYGENSEFSIFADSGIVYVPGRPYMITVLIKGKDSTMQTRQWAVDLMKEISQHAYDIGKK